jgi:hypothetical protein
LDFSAVEPAAERRSVATAAEKAMRFKKLCILQVLSASVVVVERLVSIDAATTWLMRLQ